MNVYGREGYIDSNYNTLNDEAPYFSPIKSASVIKLRGSSKNKLTFDFHKEPQTKSPDQIPKSAVLDLKRDSHPSPRNPLRNIYPFDQYKKKQEMKTSIIKEDPADVVVFDKKQMKQFLLGVWDQMSSHLGTIKSLKKKLGNPLDFGQIQKNAFMKKNIRINSYGVPIYQVMCMQ